MAEEPGDEVIRCDGDLVTAGLVNTITTSTSG